MYGRGGAWAGRANLTCIRPCQDVVVSWRTPTTEIPPSGPTALVGGSQLEAGEYHHRPRRNVPQWSAGASRSHAWRTIGRTDGRTDLKLAVTGPGPASTPRVDSLRWT